MKGLHVGWLLRPDVRALVARRVLELDLLAGLLGVRSRSEIRIFEEDGKRRLWVPSDAPAREVDIQLAFTGAEVVGNQLLQTLLWLSLGKPGDLKTSAQLWVDEHLPGMTWVTDQLLIAFHRVLAHVVNNPNVAFPPLEPVVRLPAPRLRSDLDIPYMRPLAGAPLDVAEAELEEFYRRSREELAAQRRLAEGRRPQATGDDYFRWGEMTCRYLVEKASINALTREEWGDDWRDRSSGIRYRIGQARKYL